MIPLAMTKEEVIELLEQKDELILITTTEEEITDEVLDQPHLYSRFTVAESNAKRLRDEKKSEVVRQIREDYITEHEKQPAKNFVDEQLELNTEYIELCYLRGLCEGITKSFYMRGQSVLKSIDLITSGRFNPTNLKKEVKERVQKRSAEKETKKLNSKRRRRS